MNQKKWNEIVNCTNSSKVYHLYEWGKLLSEVHGYKLIYLEESNGVFPLAYVKSFIFGNRLISLPFADYGGLCCHDIEVAERLIFACEELAKELNIDFIEIRCPDNRFHKIFEKHGFVRRDEYITFILRLDKNIQELWKGIGNKNRNMVRKAQRNGLEIIEGRSKEDLKEFYSIYLETMKRKGSPPQPFKFFEKMWDLFYPQNLIMPLVRYRDKFIAGGLFFLYKNTIHHAYGCSLKEYLHLAPNDLLMWYIIEWGNEHGYSVLDFGRTREGEGTVLFKKRWGGERTYMPYFYKLYKKKTIKRPEFKYKWISELWKRYVPKLLANKIGPWIIRQIG